MYYRISISRVQQDDSGIFIWDTMVNQIDLELSISLYFQLINLDSFDYQSSWVTFRITKSDILNLEYEYFNQDDFEFIRLLYSVLDMGFVVGVDMFVHPAL